MYMQPFELHAWALDRQQQLTREYQESCTSQRRARQRLGQALHWLGDRFVIWGKQLQMPAQTMELGQQ